MSLVMGMWYVAAASGEFITKDVVRNSPIANQLSPIAERILAEHSCKIQNVKQILDSELGHHGLDGLVAAFFARYPFIEFRPGVYFSAPHPYVRLFAVTSPVFRMLELARARAANGSKDHLESPESQQMGTRFESLVQELLAEGFDSNRIVTEHLISKREQRLSPDLLLFEDQGATLIQAKSNVSREMPFWVRHESCGAGCGQGDCRNYHEEH